MPVADNIDTCSAAGRLVLTVLASVSQWEREIIVERTADAMRHLKAGGKVYSRPLMSFDAIGGKLLPLLIKPGNCSLFSCFSGGRALAEFIDQRFNVILSIGIMSASPYIGSRRQDRGESPLT